jgi:hypothetical protein
MRFSFEVTIPIFQKRIEIIIMGDITCKIILDKNLPKKYAVGEYILFASSLFITGAYKGTCKTTLILALKLS